MPTSDRRATSAYQPAYQPALKWPDHAWRLLLVLLSSAVALAPVLHERSAAHLAIEAVIGVLALALTVLRRRRPFAVAASTAVLTAFSTLAYGPWLLAYASLATRRRWREVLVGGLLGLVAMSVLTRRTPEARVDPSWVQDLSEVLFIAVVVAVGMYVGARRELVYNLRLRARQAETERDLRVAHARAEERREIAREMHDVLAHRISQITVHAGALAYRAGLGDAEVQEAGQVIRTASHQALVELRSILGVLRDPTPGQCSVSRPGHADVDTLVAEAVTSGVRVELDDRLAADSVPDGAASTIYRVVREGLTNARKHAPEAELTILITGEPEEGITVLLRNEVGPPSSVTPESELGAGLGLVGLAERVELRGGRLEHGRDGATFVLRCWMPWRS